MCEIAMIRFLKSKFYLMNLSSKGKADSFSEAVEHR